MYFAVRMKVLPKEAVCVLLGGFGSFDVVESADSINLSDGSPGVEVREHP
jgi:hypothetical protein